MTEKVINEFWKAEDVAKYLNCAVQTIRDKTYRKDIPHIKIPGGGVRYRKEDIDKWLIERKAR